MGRCSVGFLILRILWYNFNRPGGKCRKGFFCPSQSLELAWCSWKNCKEKKQDKNLCNFFKIVFQHNSFSKTKLTYLHCRPHWSLHPQIGQGQQYYPVGVFLWIAYMYVIIYTISKMTVKIEIHLQNIKSPTKFELPRRKMWISVLYYIILYQIIHEGRIFDKKNWKLTLKTFRSFKSTWG